jgi:hypothetical protein
MRVEDASGRDAKYCWSFQDVLEAVRCGWEEDRRDMAWEWEWCEGEEGKEELGRVGRWLRWQLAAGSCQSLGSGQRLRKARAR